MSQLELMGIPEAKNQEIIAVAKRINPNNIGYSKHPLFAVYHGMLNRCNNPNQENYRFYGAVGVRVCAEWIEGIPNFLRDMELSWPGPGYDLDRINPNGDYCKENCRWIVRRENISRANRSRLGMRYKRKYWT